jgi:hypothetical protein
MSKPNASRPEPLVGTIIVSRGKIAEAHNKVRYISRPLHRIENLSELGWEEMNDLRRAVHQNEVMLQGLLETEKERLGAIA